MIKIIFSIDLNYEIEGPSTCGKKGIMEQGAGCFLLNMWDKQVLVLRGNSSDNDVLFE